MTDKTSLAKPRKHYAFPLGAVEQSAEIKTIKVMTNFIYEGANLQRNAKAPI